MQMTVTFRHMETSEPVRNYVEEKLDARYAPSGT